MTKKYFTDNEGYKHEAEFGPDDKPVSDKKYDQDGNLVGEGIYQNGKFVGEKKADKIKKATMKLDFTHKNSSQITNFGREDR